jgi:hypothetical protein
MKTLVRLGCNLAIHVSQAVLDTFDAKRPMVDDPLVDGLDSPVYGPRLLWGPIPETVSTANENAIFASDRFSRVGTPPAGAGGHK